MRNELLTLQAHGRAYRMRDTGGKISQCMRQGRPYEQGLLEHIHARRYRGVAVDVGANIGNHTLWFAIVCGLHVVAFEPLQHELLTEHVRLNDVGDRVAVHAVALGDRDGVAAHVGKGRLDPDRATGEPADRVPDVASGRWVGSGAGVPVARLDAHALTDVALIKVDVEGMEPAVLRGAVETIARCRPVIYAEAWRDPPARRARRRLSIAHRRIRDILAPLGYRHARSFRSGPVEEWEPA